MPHAAPTGSPRVGLLAGAGVLIVLLALVSGVALAAVVARWAAGKADGAQDDGASFLGGPQLDSSTVVLV